MLPLSFKLNKTKLNIFPIFDLELYEGGGGMEEWRDGSHYGESDKMIT